jgi:hypothetical protein
LGVLLLGLCQACGVYSFTGAAIEGKTINIHYIDNVARNIVPSLSPTLTEKIRNRILSQSSLSQVNSEKTDYDLSGTITGYEVSVASVSGNETSVQNRLTITLSIDFKNRQNEKANFVQTFTRFKDFSSSQNIQNIENALITEIAEQLADDIFNKAFVNW